MTASGAGGSVVVTWDPQFLVLFAFPAKTGLGAMTFFQTSSKLWAWITVCLMQH